VLNNANP
jgi:hypothetical protein